MIWILLVVLAWHIISEILSRIERDKLMNRIMSIDYKEYQYYDKKFPEDVREVVRLREREDRAVQAQIKGREKGTLQDIGDTEVIPKEVEQFLANSESDWAPEEIDIVKAKELIGAMDEPEDDRK